MANQYIGVGGVGRKVKSEYVGVDGIARKVKSGYVGVSGINRKYFPGGIPLATFAEGSIVKINEAGKPVEFYVAKHNYEPGLNGNGRTLLVRKVGVDKREWHNLRVNVYASSKIDAWLNGDYKNLLDAETRRTIGTTKIRHTHGDHNFTVGILTRAVFLLSVTELGQSHTYANVEGSVLPIASKLNMVNYNGSRDDQWTRSPNTYDSYGAWVLNHWGEPEYSDCNEIHVSRPSFTFPSTAPFDNNMNFIGA